MPALKGPEDQILKLSRPKADRQEADGRVSVTRPPGFGLPLAGFGVDFPQRRDVRSGISDLRREAARRTECS